MTIENLARVAPPPAAPFEAFVGPWQPIETAVGTPLPQDLKDFARLYGSGGFMDFMWIAVPWPSDRGVTYARWVGEACRTFQALSLPYPVWPDAGGLFPAGSTENGDQIFWLPRRDTEAWRVVVWDRGGCEGEDVETFDCDLTDFLAGLATGAIIPKAFPDDFYPFEPIFQPGRS
ncbi:SMI1/KNR4 family protein [Phenylobacterium sp.]|uniref:SMI1/KNR4 family protein n=1 Tax=Phenylobacterium sp. TaxID=1871053 RepID=UPI002EDA1512